jgi:hypothetical protein
MRFLVLIVAACTLAAGCVAYSERTVAVQPAPPPPPMAVVYY